MITLMVISVIIIGITSLSLKKSEIKKLDVRPVLMPSNSYSQPLTTNINNVMDLEEQYHSLRNLLNIPTSSRSSNTQQLTPTTACHSSSVVTEDKKQVKYVTVEGVQYRIRSKCLKLCNKHIKNITDIQGLDKMWRLRKLDLSHNQIESMKGIEYLPNLRTLKLSYNKIQKFENVKHFKQLKNLIIDNNQLKELHAADLPNTLKHINIAKNPIEKFTIYTKATFKIIHFGPKKWFPQQEIKQLKKQMHHLSKSYKSYSSKVNFTKGLIYFAVWAVLSLIVALLINLVFWGLLTGGNTEYWVFLFTQGLWTFAVGAIGAIFIMFFVYMELNG